MENTYFLTSPQNPILLGWETHQRVMAMTLEYERETGKTPKRILLPPDLFFAIAEYSHTMASFNDSEIMKDDLAILGEFMGGEENAQVDTGRGLVPCILDPFVPEGVIEIE